MHGEVKFATKLLVETAELDIQSNESRLRDKPTAYRSQKSDLGRPDGNEHENL